MMLRLGDLVDVTRVRGVAIATIRARFAVLTVGYSARLGTADPATVHAAHKRLTQVCPADHDLVCEMDRFVADLPMIRHCAGDLSAAGQRLIRAVERTTWPDRGERADIHG